MEKQPDREVPVGTRAREGAGTFIQSGCRVCDADAKEILERIGAKYLLATLYNNLAAISYEMGEKDKVEKYLNTAIEIHRSHNNLEGQAHSLNNMAAFLYEKEPARAKEYIQKALMVSEQIQDLDGQATYLHNLGAVSSKMNELEQAALYYMATALPIELTFGLRSRGSLRSIAN